ncbi:MAG: hypothetical protein EZS28_005153 [Streblomastix strix]|uniref:Uncharacterized protein n=1 Tax=Streblomastix strix TaxID=222440 RepID=A0A5J4WYN2_9EUKA|nr:MAG: hypothetical protein EZS28_005153 [Streblomastix strix]
MATVTPAKRSDSKTPGKTPASQQASPIARLSVLNEKISSVNQDQEKLANKKKQEEDERIMILRDNVLNIEQSLTTEIKQRQEAGQAFQTQVDERAASMQESFAQNTKERMALVVPTLETLTARFVPVERDILEKDLQIKRLEEASILLVRQVDLFQQMKEMVNFRISFGMNLKLLNKKLFICNPRLS